jgi:hypothetical protein
MKKLIPKLEYQQSIQSILIILNLKIDANKRNLDSLQFRESEIHASGTSVTVQSDPSKKRHILIFLNQNTKLEYRPSYLD